MEAVAAELVALRQMLLQLMASVVMKEPDAVEEVAAMRAATLRSLQQSTFNVDPAASDRIRARAEAIVGDTFDALGRKLA